MINITIYQNEQDVYTGFRMEGHAGYAEHGEDIVCAAVSVLVINTINSIEAFSEDTFHASIHEENDVVAFQITSDPVTASAKLLLRSLVLGLQGIQGEYGKRYLKMKIKKKQEV